MTAMADELPRRYVYAVVGAEGAETLAVPGDGVHGAPVTLLPCGPVAAVVSPLGDKRVRSTRADLSAHERVVEHVAAATTTVPLQFGAVMPDEATVIDDLLAPNGEPLTKLLEDLAGKTEHRLKATYRGDSALREAVEGSAAIRRLRERIRSKGEAAAYHDRIQLGELVAAALRRIAEDDAAAILRRIEPHAQATAVLPSRREDVALHAAFLVDDGAVAGFDRAVEQLADDLQERMSFELVGPLAAWDFVPDGEYVPGAPEPPGEARRR